MASTRRRAHAWPQQHDAPLVIQSVRTQLTRMALRLVQTASEAAPSSAEIWLIGAASGLGARPVRDAGYRHFGAASQPFQGHTVPPDRIQSSA